MVPCGEVTVGLRRGDVVGPQHDVTELGPAQQRGGDHLAEHADHELVVGVDVPQLRRALHLQEAVRAQQPPELQRGQRGS
jgi:hypothetical protein